MATVVWRATVDDLHRVEGKAELVGGELVLMHASGGWHGIASKNILVSLDRHAKKIRSGFAFGDNIAFLCDLPARHSFSPDCAYYVGSPPDADFLPMAPIFAVEVRGKEDYGSGAERRMSKKREDYFVAGTAVVWDVDPKTSEIRVYRPTNPEAPTIYGPGTQADAEPAVTGWTFPVDELLA
ncbi:MAG TPA: Uma2 family endonuclease [Pirellulales bacterium]|nr:Uma2 family endonuclease [Pirellulales bacterium]